MPSRPHDWRGVFLTSFGPGLLGGVTMGDWLRLLREQRFAVSPSCLPRAVSITVQSVRNSILGSLESRRFGRKLKDVVVPPPLFVLGHWRNGTTHLHNLLCVDQRFAFPNNYQVYFPHIFLSTEAKGSRALAFFFPRRRPMDNVEWNLQSPQEDEFALCVTSFKSPCMGWIFPRSRDHFDRYLTFRGVAEGEIAEWRRAFDLFLRKLTLKHGRPLILKSPPHTARIRLLLQMFPGAKFVHIHRHPHTVFQSTRSMFEVNPRWHCLQHPRTDDLDGWVIRQYREVYDAFFKERGLIPGGNFCEVGFEELEADPVGQVRRVYEALGLPEFREVEPDLEKYAASVAGYRKNVHPEIPGELRRRIAREWSACFEEWGYTP